MLTSYNITLETIYQSGNLILVKNDNEVGVLTLHRAEGKNSFSAVMMCDFKEALSACLPATTDALSNLRATVIRSSVEKVFCAGECCIYYIKCTIHAIYNYI